MAASSETIKRMSNALNLGDNGLQADGDTVFLKHWFSNEDDARDAVSLLEKLDNWKAPSGLGLSGINTVAYSRYVKDKGWEVFIEGNKPGGDFELISRRKPEEIQKLVGTGLSNIIGKDADRKQQKSDAKQEAVAAKQELARNASEYKTAFDTAFQESGIENGLVYEAQADANELARKINKFKASVTNIGPIASVKKADGKWVVNLSPDKAYHYRDDRPIDGIIDMVREHREAVNLVAANKAPLVTELEGRIGIKTARNQEIYTVTNPPLTPGEVSELTPKINAIIPGLASESAGRLVINERVLRDTTLNGLSVEKLGMLDAVQKRIAGITDRTETEQAAADRIADYQSALDAMPALRESATALVGDAKKAAVKWGAANDSLKEITAEQTAAHAEVTRLDGIIAQATGNKQTASDSVLATKAALEAAKTEAEAAKKAADDAKVTLEAAEKAKEDNGDKAKSAALEKAADEAKTLKDAKDTEAKAAAEKLTAAQKAAKDANDKETTLTGTLDTTTEALKKAQNDLREKTTAFTNAQTALEAAKTTAENASEAANEAIARVTTAESALPKLFEAATKAAEKANIAERPAAVPTYPAIEKPPEGMLASGVTSGSAPAAGAPAPAADPVKATAVGTAPGVTRDPADPSAPADPNAQPDPNTLEGGAPDIMQAGAGGTNKKPPAEKPTGGNVVDENKFGMGAGLIGMLLMMFMGMDPIVAILGALIIAVAASAFGDENGFMSKMGFGMAGKSPEKGKGQFTHIAVARENAKGEAVEMVDDQGTKVPTPAIYIDKDGKIVEDTTQAVFAVNGKLSGDKKTFEVTSYQPIDKNGARDAVPAPADLKIPVVSQKVGEDMLYAVAVAENLAPVVTKLSQNESKRVIDAITKDGKLTKDELTPYDTNKDGKLSKDETPEALKAHYDALLTQTAKTGEPAPTEINLNNIQAPLNLPQQQSAPGAAPNK